MIYFSSQEYDSTISGFKALYFDKRRYCPIMRVMSKEDLPHGEKIDRRRKLSAFGKDVNNVNRRIMERVQARERLTVIGKLLSPGDRTLSEMSHPQQEQNRAELEIEEIWLKFKLGIIKQAEQQRSLAEKFNDLEKGKPDVYHWLTDTDFHGPSRAQQIRTKVIPPIYIGKFHTKRLK
jgi:hypothetical protein